MKKIIILIIIATPFLMSSTCKKDIYKNAEGVRLNATINNIAETINLGDTLKITLTIPSTFVTESTQLVTVNSLQKGLYTITCYRIDTINRRPVNLNNTSSFFVSEGSNISGTVYVSNISPFRSVLNILPPQKGVYVLEILAQTGQLNVNTSDYYGLKVNFNIADKHWPMIAYYFNTYFNTDTNTFLGQLQDVNNAGYGYYGFRVN